MSKEQRRARKEEFVERIKKLRQEAKDHRSKAKDYFEEKYLQELDKIKQDKSFQKRGNRRRR